MKYIIAILKDSEDLDKFSYIYSMFQELRNIRIVQLIDPKKSYRFDMIDTYLLKSYTPQNNHKTTGGSELYDIKFEDGYIMHVTECSSQILS